MDNKKFLFIAVGAFLVFIIVVIILVVASKNKEPVNQEQTLTIWSTQDNKSALEKNLQKFQQTHPNLKIEFVLKDSQTYLEESLNEIAAGRGPDIWAIPNDWMPKYHDKLISMPEGRLADKKAKKSDTEVYKETYAPVVVQDNVIQEKIYGAPLSIETLKLYYNPKMFDDVMDESRQNSDNTIRQMFDNGPRNWQKFSALAEAVSKSSGNSISRSAVALGTADNIANSNDILTLMMLQEGAQMVSNDYSTAQFHTSYNKFGGQDFPGTHALEFYSSFADAESDNYSWNDSFSDSITAFSEGKTAMVFAYPSQEKDFKRINPNLNFRSFEMPQTKATKNPINFASYNTYTVTRAAENPELAWDLILLLTDKDNSQNYVSETGATPARLDILPEESPVRTAQSWFNPNPAETANIFKSMTSEVNSGQNAQTAIDGAAAQVTILLQKISP